jgi:hypothetical protein
VAGEAPCQEGDTPSCTAEATAIATSKLGNGVRIVSSTSWKSSAASANWINFAEIADWCSEVEGSVVPNEAARASAYEKLQRDLMEGDFEENNHSRVLYLHPWTVKAKMKRQWMENIIEITPPATIRFQYLDHCWLPRNLFQRWIAKHHLPVLAPRFQPQSRRVPASTAADESAAIKALALHLRRETAPSTASASRLSERRSRRCRTDERPPDWARRSDLARSSRTRIAMPDGIARSPEIQCRRSEAESLHLRAAAAELRPPPLGRWPFGAGRTRGLCSPFLQ